MGTRHLSVGVRPLAVVLAILTLPLPLNAQTADTPAGHASFTAGASFGDGNTALALTAGLGYRLTSRVGVDVELAHAGKLDFTVDLCPPPRVCVIGGTFPVTGWTLSLVPHVTFDILPPSQSLRVYLVAGAGMGHVRQRYFLGPLPFGGNRVEYTRSNLTPATSFGAGATVAIAPRLSLGVDVRSLFLFDDRAESDPFITPAGRLSTLRVGSRVSWAF
jgi:opacity protein-like surface antigen